MSAQGQLLLLFAGLAGVLALATATGRLLAGTAARLPPPAIDNLNRRIDAWWLMVALAALALLLGPLGVVALCAGLSFLALREWFSAVSTRRGDHAALAVVFYVVLPAPYLALLLGADALYPAVVPLAALVLVPAMVLAGGDSRDLVIRMGALQWGPMLAVWGLSHLAALALLELPGRPDGGLPLLAFLVLVVQASDVLQYVFGKLCGRRPVAPRLSPSKTVEGLVGGGGAATLIGGAMWWLTPFPPLGAMLLALLAVALGFLGGLVSSAVKRQCGVKDWGRAIAGHGGVLDRVDSLLLSAPVFYYLVRQIAL